MVAEDQDQPVFSNDVTIVEERRRRRKTVVDLTHSDEESGDGGEDEVIFVEEKESTAPQVFKRIMRPRTPAAPVSPVHGLKCPICLEIKRDDLCSPPCGHIVCMECLKEFMASRMVCPICRKKFTSKRILKLHCSA